MKTWLFQKIVGYLAQCEGFQFNSDDTESTDSSIRTIVQDSFGFRYEVQVKVIGRIQGAGFGEELSKAGSFLTVTGGLDV